MRRDGRRAALRANGRARCVPPELGRERWVPRTHQTALVTRAQDLATAGDEEQLVEPHRFHELHDAQAQSQTPSRVELTTPEIDEGGIEHRIVLAQRAEQQRKPRHFLPHVAAEPSDRRLEL
jgi:hypothetical protein